MVFFKIFYLLISYCLLFNCEVKWFYNTMTHFSTIISGAASFGVLAGVVSGIFYLVVAGIRWAGQLRTALQEAEEVRRRNLQEAGTCVVCSRSTDSVQTNGTTRPRGDGSCVLCSVKRDIQKTSNDWIRGAPAIENGSVPDGQHRDVEKETSQVREFIEKLVESLVGGPLDSVNVGRLSHHPDYLEMFNRYHGELCQSLARLGFLLQMSLSNRISSDKDSACSAHAALKRLVEKVVSDAMSLPNLNERTGPTTNGTCARHEDFSNTTYEDILATAILNQVIEKFQKQNHRVKDNIDKNRNLLSQSRCDSIDDDEVQSNSDWSDPGRTEPLSLTIEECIEEVTTTVESSDDEEKPEEEVGYEPKMNGRVPFPECGMDIVDASTVEEESSDTEDGKGSATEIITQADSWEDNWLFQKKKLRTQASAHHPVPVPMLVPNPSQEYRALVGGVDADELSDMSECSDSALEDIVLAEETDTKQSTTELESSLEPVSVTEDVGKSQTETFSSSSSTDVDEMMKRAEENAKKRLEELSKLTSSPEPSSQEDVSIVEAQNKLVNAIEYSEDSPDISLTQKDRECTVDYEEVPMMKTPDAPIPKPRSVDFLSFMESTVDKPPKCPIAEREKAKWEKAAPMENNPYTAENIEKRLSGGRRTDYVSRNGSGDAIEFPEMNEVQETSQTPKPVLEQRLKRDYYVNNEQQSELDSGPGTPTSLSSSEKQEVEDKEPILELETSTQTNVVLDSNNTVTVNIKRSTSLRKMDSFDKVDKLPSVKEIAKQFSKEKPVQTQPRTRPHSVIGLTNIERQIKEEPKIEEVKETKKEEEIDYSTTPVTEIVTKFTSSREETRRKSDVQEKIFKEVAEIMSESKRKSMERKDTEEQENVQVVIKESPVLRRRIRNDQQRFSLDVNKLVELEVPKRQSLIEDTQIEDKSSQIANKYDQKYKFAPKQVHSLTARSISKEFREGLKQHSNVRSKKSDGGSNDVGVTVPQQRPTTPPVDLRKTIAFWEQKSSSQSK